MIRRVIKKIFKNFGYVLIDSKSVVSSLDNDKRKMLLFNQVSEFTMTSFQRICSIIEAIEYISKNNVEGDIVECGVWKGGSMMTAAISLLENKDHERQLYLYDTFEGMSEPNESDISINNINAKEYLDKNKKSNHDIIWAYCELDEVKHNVFKTGYPKNNVHFIKGKVEDTLPFSKHRKIALLRLDTDWYESTKCELEILFPLLVNGGVLIIDDYGYWKGCKKAVDEYFEKENIKIFLKVIDETGRIAIKQ